MIRLLFLSFLAITLLSACDDDDDRMQPIEDVIPPGLNIFECSEWETINLYKSFARRVEDTIYQTLHVNYPMICAAGANRFEVSSRIIGEGSVIFNSELTGLAFKDGAIYAAGKVGMVGRGPDTLLLGDNNQEYAGLANFQDEVYSLFGQDGDRATNTIYKIGRPTSPVSPYDTMALGRPRNCPRISVGLPMSADGVFILMNGSSFLVLPKILSWLCIKSALAVSVPTSSTLTPSLVHRSSQRQRFTTIGFTSIYCRETRVICTYFPLQVTEAKTVL
jgi:hypothetical protein